MKNLKCDVCSKQVQYIFQLHSLREVYQTKNIIQICEECNSIVDKQLYKLQRKCWDGKIEIGRISKEMKEYIIKLKDKR